MAAFDASPPNLAGLAAGALILGVGVFVLAAKPRSLLHQLFFLLALMDGGSTLLFRLAAMSLDPALAAYFEATYWYFFVAFVALLAAFGLCFPTWRGRQRTLVLALGGVAVCAGAVVGGYVLDRSLLWVPGADGGFDVQPVGNAVNVVYVAAIALLVARLTRVVLREPSVSHRRQGAYVLGGMTLAFAPYPATLSFQALTRHESTYFASRLDGALAYWAFAAVTASLAASALLLARAPGGRAREERRFVLACYAGVLALAVLALALRAVEVSRLLRTLALLAYPILLGFAIVRYEVFDIDRKLRRTTTLTLLAVSLMGIFIVAENALEGLLQDRLQGSGVSSAFAAGSVAAILTAAAGVPVLRGAQKVSRRVIPELTMDEVHRRKLEIYRHSLAGALADGILREGESRTLTALRESLGITPAEHEALVREVTPA